MMLKNLEQKVADFIATEGLLRPAQKVLLAVSGGADSTALLYIMAALVADGVLPVEICCAHVNHQLRGADAQRDEDFVVSQCSKLNVPVITKQIDVRGYARTEKLSIETAARKLRIDALLDIAARENCSCIATAHQKNDNAETILHRMVRGTGFRGLCGIWPAKQFTGGIRFVRSLLCASRDEVVQYLNSRNLKWCTDRTNVDCIYRRNYIRHQLIPALQNDCVGNIVEQLSELATASRGFNRLICEKAGAIWSDVAAVDKLAVILDSDRFAEQPQEIKIEIVRKALFCLDVGEQEITRQHYENILRLSNGDKLQLPKGVDVLRQGGTTFFGHRQVRPQAPNFMLGVNLNVPGKTEFAGKLIEAEVFDYDAADFEKFRATKSDSVEWLDFEKLKLPLAVRFRRNGDRFWPLGMRAEKKIGKFLTDAKVSPASRKNLFVIADSEKIIWLCPVRISEQAKVTSKTKSILQLHVTDDPQSQKQGAADD
ncbi:MAG: tRNA lysidine(34) synthetase TilS [Planctomycetota bacterium]